jgi:outer membrane lipopolysaccharide assembly protein LptE/RlpB
MRRIRNSSRRIVVLVVGCLTLTACGYQFVGQGGAFPDNVERIHVEMLANKTSQTGLENTVTNQIIFEFTRRNKAALADSLENADALLSGVVASKTVQTVAPKGKDAAAQRRVTVSLNLKLTRVGGQIIWVGSGITDNEVYPVAGDKLATEQNEREAILLLSARLAERIYNRLTDNF